MSAAPDPQRELDDLLGDLVDGTLTPDRAARLQNLASDDPAAMARYLDALELHAALSWANRSTAAGVSASASAPASDLVDTRLTPPVAARRIPQIIYAAAAALLLAAGALVVYLATTPGPASPADDGLLPPSIIGTVVDTDGGGTLLIGDRVVTAGEDVTTGRLALDGGSVDLRQGNGVGVRLHGPTQLTIDGPMSATLTAGSATFDCPPAAVGYTVHLPGGARVIDLGTAFTLHIVSELRTVLTVAEGSVEFRLPGAEPRRVRADESVELYAGRFASSIVTDLSDPRPPLTFTPAADDLLQTAVAARELLPPAADDGVFGGQHVDALTNAPAVWHDDRRQTVESFSTLDGGAIVWHLDTAAAPEGYTLDALIALTGCWPNRIGHLYAVDVSRVGDERFHRLFRVERPDNSADSRGVFERLAHTRRADGEPLVTGVDAVRITFYDDEPHGENLGQSVYREIDLIGRPTAADRPEDAAPAPDTTDEKNNPRPSDRTAAIERELP